MIGRQALGCTVIATVQMHEQADPHILIDRRGAAGLITLNRPQALNALTRSMIRRLRAILDAWREDADVTRVIVTAVPGRAFCAGGDLREIYDLGRAGRQAEALAFFREEYALNSAIKHYPKPHIALIDGIVMGGGVGISAHGSHRVAGEALAFAMPEVGIGFFPDVGATWLLSRLPAQIGTYCALTADRLNMADALSVGVATHRVPAQQLMDLREALCGTAAVDDVIADFATAWEGGPVFAQRATISRMFAGETVEDILAALDREIGASGDPAWATRTAAMMRAKAPLSLKIALAQMRKGLGWSFDECMRAEFRIVSRILYEHDFYEGVRALIVDKDNKPCWHPDRLDAVSRSDVDRHFAEIDEEFAAS